MPLFQYLMVNTVIQAGVVINVSIDCNKVGMESSHGYWINTGC